MQPDDAMPQRNLLKGRSDLKTGQKGGWNENYTVDYRNYLYRRPADADRRIQDSVLTESGGALCETPPV
ncbi:hypothetical protein [Mixta calida]|uniref:hypothetical protein n=1 Tax=Mixta calida TaxID=665913 RepID=UPI00142E70B0|nr:hypothetical protein [Mixta calida]